MEQRRTVMMRAPGMNDAERKAAVRSILKRARDVVCVWHEAEWWTQFTLPVKQANALRRIFPAEIKLQPKRPATRLRKAS